MRFSGLLSLRLLRWAYRHAGSFDVVHVHLARDLIPLLTATIAGRAGTPFVVQTHGMIVPDQRAAARLLDRLLTRRALQQAVARLVLTPQERTDLQQVVGDGAPLTVLRNGVTVPERRPAGGEPTDVLFLGRLHPRKRVLDFARAALALSEEGVPARFSVVGPDDGDLPELRRLIHDRPGAADVLRYEGAMSHDRAVARMAAADIFVLPAVDEPFGMTLLEAMAAGVPSVCTTGCGLAEELSADGSVLAVEPGVESLTAAVRRLVHDGEYRSRLGAAGRRTVEARYSMREVGDQLLRIYRGAQ
jgi:glycosyltransferase involved in cell wall biosynthesis